MIKLFISGSRLANLCEDSLVKLRDCILENIPEFDPETALILVGDCDGIDTDIQSLDLNCLVYHVGRVRNNPYKHPTHEVKNKGKTGREYYSQKDQVMTNECSHHIGLAKGSSQGTRANHQRALGQHKPSWLIEL